MAIFRLVAAARASRAAKNHSAAAEYHHDGTKREQRDLDYLIPIHSKPTEPCQKAAAIGLGQGRTSGRAADTRGIPH
jgi:hypothetical protein